MLTSVRSGFRRLRAEFGGFNRALTKSGTPRGRIAQAGMTLIEIIIVVALLGTLMTILVRSLTGSQQQAQIGETKLVFGNVQSALDMYKVNTNKYPASLDALLTDPGNVKNWHGPYIEADKLNDAWGNKIQYESDGNKYTLTSAGPDGNFGTADDMKFPEDQAASGSSSGGSGQTESGG